MRSTHRLTTLSVGLLCLACDAPPPALASFSVRDSAGIRIVESVAPAWAESEAWSVDSMPDVVIGQIDGDERYLLSQVRGIDVFDDGRIALLDYAGRRVRVYSAEGVHLFDAGGPGDGPSELQSPQWLDVREDTIRVIQTPFAVTRFTDSGEFVDVAALPEPESGRLMFGYVFGTLADGSWATLVDIPGRPSYPAGRVREEMAVWTWAADAPPDSLFRVETAQLFVQPSGGWNDVVFGRNTVLAGAGDRIWAAETGAYSIHGYAPDGSLRTILRRSWTPDPVETADLRAYFEQGPAGADPERVERLIALQAGTERVAEVKPSLRLIVPDDTGHLWVEDFDDVGMLAGAFSIFDPAGAWLGRVEVPRELTWLRGINGWNAVVLVRGDRLYGIWTDDLGVEQLRVYRIRKGD